MTEPAGTISRFPAKNRASRAVGRPRVAYETAVINVKVSKLCTKAAALS